MRFRTLLLSIGVFALACSAATSQPPPKPLKPIPTTTLDFFPPPPATVVVPIPPPLPAAPPTVVPPVVRASDPIPAIPPLPATPKLEFPTPPTPPAEKTVDDFIKELERIQAQKAELEKQEKELKAALSKKLEQQTERLKKLGVIPKEPDKVGRIIIEGSSQPIRPLPKPVEPDRVGQIFIEGNTKTPNKKILDMLDFSPGRVLEYPALETARAKLEKAGFKSVTVEVIPSEGDSTFKDIYVKLIEPDAQKP